MRIATPSGKVIQILNFLNSNVVGKVSNVNMLGKISISVSNYSAQLKIKIQALREK